MALNRGALKAIAVAVRENRLSKERLAEQEREFQNRLKVALARSGEFDIDPNTGELVRKQAPTSEQIGEQIEAFRGLPGAADLQPSFEFGARGGLEGFKLTRPRAALLKPPSEAEARRIQLGAVPGQPLPAQPFQATAEFPPDSGEFIKLGLAGGLPSTPGGAALVNQLIASGQTESPAAQIRRPLTTQRPSLIDIIRAAALQQFGGLVRERPGSQAAQATGPQLDPQDRSLQGPTGSTEGARVQLDDGSVWIVQGGQWVQE